MQVTASSGKRYLIPADAVNIWGGKKEEEKKKEHPPFYGEIRSACTGRTLSNPKLVNNATVRKVTKRPDTSSAT